MTNYEKIKQMSVEEMAKFIYEIYLEGYYAGLHEAIYAPVCDKEWLNQEVEE